jgi:endonuclease G
VYAGSATPDDYSRSGYDRGHLAPSADFRWDEQAQSESFFMSNMSPQTPAFNRGIWKHLEEQVRDWAKELDTVYVITGPVLSSGLQTIGSSNVAVPEYYYKVILDHKESKTEAIGFILRNEGSKESLADFAVSVDSVEKITGIDFFPMLPDSIETVGESKVDLAFWHLDRGEPIITGVSSKQSIASKPLPPGFKRMKLVRHNKCLKECPPENRIGAACADGTRSENNGSGACAGHGGVECWECR